MKRRILNMSRNNQSSQSNIRTNGLCISGTVIERTRRHVPKDNPTTEIVTYTLGDCNDRKYYVDDYAPSSYHEVGTSVSFPVYVKPYTKKNGEPAYNLCIQKMPSSRGEHF